MLIVVVLPDPFGPISPTNSPASTREIERVDRDDPAEAPAQPRRLDQRGHRTASRAGSARRSCSQPSASNPLRANRMVSSSNAPNSTSRHCP